MIARLPSCGWLFAAATLWPLPLLLVALFSGGAPVWLALGSMTVFLPLMDHALRYLPENARPAESEFPAGTGLSLILAGAQVILLLAAVASMPGAGLSGAESLALFVAVGLWLGQVGNSNAHELIHRSDARLFTCGKWLFISLLFGHHTSAHRHVHHRYVASPRDPNSAPLGRSFYAFAPRAWIGSFRAGWRVERARIAQVGVPPWRNPYVEYIGGAALCLALALLIGGPAGLGWYVALALYAQGQLLLSDYVQHYGLARAEIAPGQYEPVGPAHSWNAPQRWSSALMLNAPRHSDHHGHPARPFPALRTGPASEVPTLPFSLPVMATLALSPTLWRRMMDRRARNWRTA